MNHDLLIKNGTVIDGTGKDRFRGDVAVKAGRIVQVGRVDGAAAKVIDAQGQIVCPGFVDPHTHYDAQITWDRLLSSSAEHGITTVTMGNCGVGIAPCRPEAREVAMYLVTRCCDRTLGESARLFGLGSYGAVGWVCHGLKVRMEREKKLETK